MTDEESDSLSKSLSRLLAAQRAMKDIGTYSLEELTIEQAQQIATVSVGQPVFLNSLKTLSPEVARALGNEHIALALNGLETLGVETAEALLCCPKRNLFLNGLKDISVALVDALDDRHNVLGLNGLKRLSDDVAEALNSHGGEQLTLKGLREISYKAASSLFYSDFASLSLIGLEQDGVTFEAYELLRFCERNIEFPDCFSRWDYGDPDESLE